MQVVYGVAPSEGRGGWHNCVSLEVTKGHNPALVVFVWLLDLQQPVQSVPITTNVVSSNLIHDEVYSIQHYVIKFLSDLQQVSGVVQVLRFPPLIKQNATI